MRTRHEVLLGVGILTAVLMGVAGMALLGFAFQATFARGFEVVNDSGEGVEFVPIGMWEGSGEYGPLPQCRRSFPHIPLRHRPFSMAAGATALVFYDWDDINFRHLLVKDGPGRVLILDTDKVGSTQFCYPPQRDVYRIPPVKELQPADRQLVPCFGGQTVAYAGARQYPCP
jgi:hypothetical protein